MLPSGTGFWQPEFTDKILSRKTGAVHKEENRRYKQQFVIWQYNAYKHGMTEHQLNAQLTKIDRERSDGEKR